MEFWLINVSAWISFYCHVLTSRSHIVNIFALKCKYDDKQHSWQQYNRNVPYSEIDLITYYCSLCAVFWVFVLQTFKLAALQQRSGLLQREKVLNGDKVVVDAWNLPIPWLPGRTCGYRDTVSLGQNSTPLQALVKYHFTINFNYPHSGNRNIWLHWSLPFLSGSIFLQADL